MSNLKKFISFAESKLGDMLKESGNILYSSASTLRPGSVYLIGYNPGGDPDCIKTTIQETLNGLPGKTENGYIDESWGGKEAGKNILQCRVRYLLEDICGLKTEEVCASNLIFKRSEDAKSIKFKECADICWPVHERIIQIVSPSLIIAFGNGNNSPYSYLRNRLKGKDEDWIKSGYGKKRIWYCKSFRSDKGILVIGLPHLSRYAINLEKYKHAKKWIQGKKWRSSKMTNHRIL